MPESFITQLSHRAMATEFVVMLASADSEAAEETLRALEQLDEIEAALSVYREESEISEVNRNAAARPVVVSAETYSLIEKAIRWSQRTAGAFDITAGPLVEVWGFGKRRGRKPSREEIDQSRERVGYQHLEMDPERRSVRFTRPGMKVNLGGIGKGDALDRLAQRLRDRGIDDFLMHGGNSSVIAAGNQQPGSGQGWSVGISHPTKPSHRVAGIRLHDQALATSGSGKQFFHHRGRRYGHVIDPRTGYPAGDFLSLTVTCSSAADADALATGWFVAGSESLDESGLGQEEAAIMVNAGDRQDAVTINSVGKIDWVEGGCSRAEN